MNIVYNDRDEIYKIDLTEPYPKVFICASNIVEARQKFINYMTYLFDESINKRLKD